MIIINGEHLDDGVDEPERCPVCGGHEPCSHNFDEMREDLEEIGRLMGSDQPAPTATPSTETPEQLEVMMAIKRAQPEVPPPADR